MPTKAKQSSPEDEIALTQLAVELQRQFGAPGPGYHAAYRKIVDGRLPALRRRGRYYILRGDLRLAAAVLGIVEAGG